MKSTVIQGRARINQVHKRRIKTQLVEECSAQRRGGSITQVFDMCVGKRMYRCAGKSEMYRKLGEVKTEINTHSVCWRWSGFVSGNPVGVVILLKEGNHRKTSKRK